jgi:hypothetical protein
MYDPVKAHDAYIKRRNRMYWYRKRAEAIDQIMWDFSCCYKSAVDIYNKEQHGIVTKIDQ